MLYDYPFTLLVELSGTCNFRCVYCHTAHRLGDISGQELIKPEFMPASTANKAFRGLEKFPQSMRTILFGWYGEPLMHPGFSDIWRKLAVENADLKLAETICLPTNAALLTQDHIQALLDGAALMPEAGVHIIVSVDACSSDTFRKIKGVDALKQVQRNIRTFLKERKKREACRPTLAIQFFVLEENSSQVKDFCQYWSDMISEYGRPPAVVAGTCFMKFQDVISVTTPIAQGAAAGDLKMLFNQSISHIQIDENPDSYRVLEQGSRDLRSVTEAIAIGPGESGDFVERPGDLVERPGGLSVEGHGEKPEKPGDDFPFCLAPWELMMVSPAGKVTVCCHDRDTEIAAGSLDNQELYQIWTGKKLNQYRTMMLYGDKGISDACAGCTMDFQTKYLDNMLMQLARKRVNTCLASPYQVEDLIELCDNVDIRDVLPESALFMLPLIEKLGVWDEVRKKAVIQQLYPEIGRRLFAQNRPDEAIPYLEALISRKDNPDIWALKTLAWLAMQKGEHIRAAEYYEWLLNLIQENPDETGEISKLTILEALTICREKSGSSPDLAGPDRKPEDHDRDKLEYPFMLLMELTETCNFRCSYCHTHRQTGKTNRNPVYIEPAIIKKALQGMAEFPAGRRATMFGWYGEPLLHPEFEQIWTSFCRNNQNCELVDTIGFPTNAAMMNDRIIDLLLTGAEHMSSAGFHLIISIDAFQRETFKRIKGVDALNTVTRNIESFLIERKKRNLTRPTLALQYYVMDENSQEIKEFCDFWKYMICRYADMPALVQGCGFLDNRDVISVTTPLVQGENSMHLKKLYEDQISGMSFEDNRHSYRCFENTTAPLGSEATEVAMEPEATEAALESGAGSCFGHSGKKICLSPWECLAVVPSGLVTVCCRDKGLTMQAGDLNKESLCQIWHGDTMEEYRRRMLSPNRRISSLCDSCTMDYRYCHAEDLLEHAVMEHVNKHRNHHGTLNACIELCNHMTLEDVITPSGRFLLPLIREMNIWDNIRERIVITQLYPEISRKLFSMNRIAEARPYLEQLYNADYPGYIVDRWVIQTLAWIFMQEKRFGDAVPLYRHLLKQIKETSPKSGESADSIPEENIMEALRYCLEKAETQSEAGRVDK